MTTVLIITHSGDNESVEAVARAVAGRGGRAVRLDTDRFPTETRLAARYGGAGAGRVTFLAGAGEFDLSEVGAVWHRRLGVAARVTREMDPQLRAASVGESRASLLGVLAGLTAFRVDPEAAIRRAEHKPLQLRAARGLGLEVPRTLVTNDPAAARDFYAECGGRLVMKMLSSFAVYDREGRENVVFTNPVGREDLEDLTGLSLCPATFQERVEKRLELRATVVGRRVFTASIDSQSSARAAHDWRRDGVGLVDEWLPYTLPPEVEGGLLALMDYFGLNYGAADFILTPDDRHVFLEVNPSGEFFWLDGPELPISSALADVLLGLAPRRE
ncbi:MAG: MvdD family ATP-grasp ribosomal peptide maturase [Acidobacteria bacterium]|nr:MvdD family ATP-grasp ribosomal peptide maturase [Acidobacteriota bacterium]